MSKPIISMASLWASLEQAALHPQTPKLQRREMRRMFYAGAQALFGVMMAELDPGEEPTDNDMARMQSIAEELERFGRDVAGGRA